MRRTKWNALAFLFSGALILAACGGQGTESADASEPDGSQAAGPSESAATGGEFADTITMALDAQVGLISNANTDVPTGRITALIYDFLYTLNDALEPTPQLASDLCEVSEDEITWTCSIVDNASFHNGDPITVDDVVYTYQLAISENCTYNPSVCLSPFVESVEATDESTVEFTLIEPYAPFATVVLPGIGIESKAVIEAAYEEFAGGAEGIDPAAVNAAIESITAATSAEELDSAACEAAAAEGTALLDEAELEYGALEDFVVEDDPETEEDETSDGQCDFAASLLPTLTGLAGSLEGEGTDAVAAVYSLLSFNQTPVGSGPYQLESCDLDGCVLTAFADYYNGAPVTQTIEMPIRTDVATAAQELAAGQLDWVNDLTPDARVALEGAVADGTVKLAEYNDFGNYDLMFNMHEAIPLPDGTEWQGWFYDINLRQAVQNCVDKAEIVEIATDGNGVPIEADIPPASWAFNPDLTPVERNVETATGLIESSSLHTWTLGDDGIYVNENGDRLSATVLVRAGQQDRIDFMNLLKDQVAECGIEIIVEPADFQTVLLPSLDWPHIPTGASEPWHAYFGGWGVTADPDPYALFHGSQCTSEDQPATYNYVCLQDDEIDRLIEEGLATSDQAERTEIYFAYQERMQELQPYLFGWSNVNADGLAAGMSYDDGELELDSPNWGWRREHLAKASE
ncbi:MAG TPA: ABC transporter substrate-binding protein [Candidatus Limnocylindria bacterium]|jgi:ABC-type transport system substrate-binding protein